MRVDRSLLNRLLFPKFSDNPSYFTIPGGLNSGTQKPGRFSLLKRHVRMGSTASNPSPPPSSPAGSRRAVPQEPQERYSTPPSANSSNSIANSATNRRSARSAVALPSKEVNYSRRNIIPLYRLHHSTEFAKSLFWIFVCERRTIKRDVFPIP